MEGRLQVARGMRMLRVEVDLATAALAVEGAHGQLEGLRVDIVAHAKRVALRSRVELDSILARRPQRGKIRPANRVARGGIGVWSGQASLQDDRVRDQ